MTKTKHYNEQFRSNTLLFLNSPIKKGIVEQMEKDIKEKDEEWKTIEGLPESGLT